MLSEELDKLRQLHNEGALSDEEYQSAKSRLLGQSSFLTESDQEKSSELLGMTANTYAMTMHLSQYAGYVIPFAGLIVPIGMWLYARDNNEFINEHGKDLMNFLISYVINVVVAFILCFVAIGFVLLPILLVFGVIAPIMGAIAASKGQTFRYPLTIKFF